MRKGKAVTLPASLQLMSGRMFRGYVKALSADTANFNSGDFARTTNNPVQPGEQGMISMTYTRNSVPFEIKASCRMLNITGNAASLAINSNDLTNTDRKAIKRILELQISEIGNDDPAG
jgi:hypothetical protein